LAFLAELGGEVFDFNKAVGTHQNAIRRAAKVLYNFHNDPFVWRVLWHLK
jgi:hypothetical protein